MLQVKKLILDILKPHSPDVLEFARNIALKGSDYKVSIKVVEIDENTETLDVIIEGENLELEAITEAVTEMGGSLHSIDGVEVTNSDTETP